MTKLATSTLPSLAIINHAGESELFQLLIILILF